MTSDYIHLMLPMMMEMMMIMTIDANDLLPVWHTACPLWVSAKGKRTTAAPLYDKTVSPFLKYSLAISSEFYFCKSSVSGSLRDMAKLAKTSKNICFYMRSLVMIEKKIRE